MQYLQNIAKTHYDKVKYLTLGKSYEDRDIVGVKISSTPEGRSNKSSILIEAGIHAREWIAPITALFIIEALVKNNTNSFLYKNVDIYVIPLLNPDGYEYSHQSSEVGFFFFFSNKTGNLNFYVALKFLDQNIY